MSFLKRLLGLGGRDATTANQPKTTSEIDYKGFKIEARPYPEDGQYQVAGVITKTVNGETKSHRFVRADRTAGIDDATRIALAKARQIVDQRGEGMFG